MLAKRYLDKSLELIQHLQDTQLKTIEQAALLIAQAIADGHTLYAWGGPHLSIGDFGVPKEISQLRKGVSCED